ncbi:uncharacterized protein LOC119640756 [Glossina fuscipes]|uniref:Uncharacterized protein LOC119640756 n=1 Tax=Glossina fuscipes TaxID=7396 RepID=A0A9C6DWZ3_9MUSC|nr:uncharacterized protein LOC119640756 [Glossina fuscipes]KAI9578320.1 hypothetical protein GQX74_014191 [Glossina fuscipes]
MIINTNTLTATATTINQPKARSHLASKLIFQSPSMDNILKEFIVSSKPLQLRKYSNRPKIKKSKKDSRIYFIAIPPLPYRFVPGRGYDYQPLKIKPLLLDTRFSNKIMGDKNTLPTNFLQFEKSQQSTTNVKASQKSYRIETATSPVSATAKKPAESKIYNLDRADYHFNGRPTRLQAVHAAAKFKLKPEKLKANLFVDKNVIY